MKLSGPYHASGDAPDHADLAPIAEAFFAANPERLLWGSDWPHTGGGGGRRDPRLLDLVEPFRAVDNRRGLELTARWAPDEGARRALLVGNPARLYGFGR